MLAALYPGRIDLGLGRAPGSDRETMFALQRDRRQASPDDFPEQLAELHAYLEDDFPAGRTRCRDHVSETLNRSGVDLARSVGEGR